MYKRLPKKSKRRVIRYGLVAANLALLLIVVTFVVQARHTNSEAPVQNAAIAPSDNTQTVNPLDQLSSADIAVHIARVSGLDEASAVTNKADTVNAQLAVSSNDQEVIAKPQVISAGLKSRKDIQTYVVQAGDTVSSIAAKFGITSDTVRWSNSLTGDTVAAGKQLLISPVNGIVYKTTSGDTADSLAQKYHANKDLLVAINDAEISGLPIGEYIIIPDGSPPTQATGYARTAASYAGFAWGGYSPVYGGNGYDYGYCTWWVAVRRSQIGKPIPSNLGNASTWKVLAQRAGLPVGNVPQAGAVWWVPPRDYYGHVGFVEKVNDDGSVLISEMNTVGWGKVSYKTLSASQAAAYSYIY